MVPSPINKAAPCDNVRRCHTPITVAEDGNAMRVYCTTCSAMAVIRKDPNKGVPENRQYSRFYRVDILQPSDNLYYYYHPEGMSLV